MAFRVRINERKEKERKKKINFVNLKLFRSEVRICSSRVYTFVIEIKKLIKKRLNEKETHNKQKRVRKRERLSIIIEMPFIMV